MNDAKAAQRIKIMQTEAEFQAEVSRNLRRNKKLPQARNRQVMAAYWAKRARTELFKMIGAKAEK